MASKTIEPEIVDILRRGTLEGRVYKLPEQLDREVYEKVAKVLKDHDAKWDKRAKAHTFGPMGVPQRLLEAIESDKTSSLQQETQFFETPAAVVSRVVRLAELKRGLTVLEPSAGLGALAFPAASGVGSKDLVKVCENHLPFYHRLGAEGFRAIGTDFLAIDPEEASTVFDRVVMNPPFTRGLDVKHVTHAFRFLRPGGRLVSVMSNGWRDKADRASLQFRDLVDRCGVAIEEIPASAFRESGTDIATCIVVLEAL